MGETPEQRAKRKAAEAAAAAGAKRAKVEEDKGFSLYDGLPEPDPENDANAARLSEAPKANAVPKLSYVEDVSKAVFLDIDGVLRPLYGNFQMSSITMDGESVPIVEGNTEFLPSAMAALRKIVGQTGARLVLSSEWRHHPALREGVDSNLRQKGLPTVQSCTPAHKRELTGKPIRSFAIRRTREIGAWLKAHPEVCHWVALDDLDLAQADDERQPGQPLLAPRLVLTDKTACLTSRDAQEAVGILSGQLNRPRVPGEHSG